MSEFNKEKVNLYLGAVRKYMQVRGALSQKDLSVATGVGVSTMSRFLTQKTTDLNSGLIARICAVLEIPLHEIIDFVDPSFTQQFIRLVKFHKDELDDDTGEPEGNEPIFSDEVELPENTQTRRKDDFADSLTSTLAIGSAKKNITANVKVGGKPNSIPFTSSSDNQNSEMSIKDKLEALTPRQKAYMSDFLNLDIESKDLIVDIGNNLMRYFKQKGMDF